MPRALLALFACCLPLLGAGGQVAVSGAVREPGAYALGQAPTISQLLHAAGGLTHTAGSVAVLRLADSPTVAVTVRLANAGAEPDLPLNAGDRLIVPEAGAEAAVIGVQVNGFVRRPGAYPLPLGARLGDLLQAAGGLLPLASPNARLRRGAEELAVDAAAAARAELARDPVLADGDVLEVASSAALLAPEEARVTISGEVPRPGLYPRYLGMRLSDLLRAAGGLGLGADRERIWLARQTAEGRVRRVPVAPLEALTGGDADLALENGDVVQVPGLAALRPGAAPVTVAGEVYYPGAFDLTVGLTAGDLLRLAGGTTPEAWRTRALLTRGGTGGRARQIPLDLTREPLNLPLEAGDLLEVLPIEEAVYREPTVSILGVVRYAGEYERTLGMRLSDLVWVAGGVTRNPAFIACEVARTRGTRVVVMQPDLEQALAHDPQHDVALQDGDRVYVHTVGEYRRRVAEVTIEGAVALPGTYPMRADTDDLREVLERAGGLTPEAEPGGAMVLRRVNELVHPNVERYVTELYSSLIQHRLRALYGQAIQHSQVRDLQVYEDATLPALPAVSAELAVALAGSTRRLELPRDAALLADLDRRHSVLLDADGRPYPPAAAPLASEPGYVRVAIDLPAVLAGEQEFLLRPHDLVIVTRRAVTVLLMGEVISQQPLLHMPGASLADYLKLCGGLSRNGHVAHLLRVRPNGVTERAALDTVLSAGDIVLALPVPYDATRQRATLRDLASGLARLLAGFAAYALTVAR